MLEIRYNKKTGKLTGWWGTRHDSYETKLNEETGEITSGWSGQFSSHEIKLKNRPDEAITYLEIDVASKPLESWLFDGQELIANPDYIAPLPVRNPLAEIDALKVRLEELKVSK